jgi:tetratricopeptide (TPR) repeat protein
MRLAVVALGLLGCAAPQLPLPVPSPAGGCGLPLERGVEPADLGFSLASLRLEIPRTSAGLAALVAQHASAPPPTVEPAPAPASFPLDSVAGADPCALADDERLARWEAPTRLVRPARPPAAAERLRSGMAALAALQWPEARAAFFAASRLQPEVVEPRLRIGDAYAAEGRWPEAGRAYEAAVAAFPWSAAAHMRLGHALRALGRVTESVRSLARALALRPASPQIHALLAAERAAEVVPPVPPPALRREDARGVRWLASDRGAGPAGLEEAAAYARCKEAFRTSEPLRLAAAELSGPRWRWSVAEETTCTVLWLSSYLDHRTQGRLSDPDLDGLAAIVQNGQADERSLFDVGAPAHDAAPAFLDDAARERLFAFVLSRRAGRRAGEGWLIP